MPEELWHVAASVLAGLAHMHRHGAIRGAATPANVLVRGPNLVELAASGGEATDGVWARANALTGSWAIGVPDLGAVEPAGPAHRRAPALAPSSAPGVWGAAVRPWERLGR